MAEKQVNARYFELELPDLATSRLTEISGFKIGTKKAQLKFQTESGQPIGFTGPNGRDDQDAITVKRQLIQDNQEWEEWFADWRVGAKYEDDMVDGSIVVYDNEGSEVARWNFQKAWPSSYAISAFESESGDPLTEELTIEMMAISRDGIEII